MWQAWHVGCRSGTSGRRWNSRCDRRRNKKVNSPPGSSVCQLPAPHCCLVEARWLLGPGDDTFAPKRRDPSRACSQDAECLRSAPGREGCAGCSVSGLRGAGAAWTAACWRRGRVGCSVGGFEAQGLRGLQRAGAGAAWAAARAGPRRRGCVGCSVLAQGPRGLQRGQASGRGGRVGCSARGPRGAGAAWAAVWAGSGAQGRTAARDEGNSGSGLGLGSRRAPHSPLVLLCDWPPSSSSQSHSAMAAVAAPSSGHSYR